VPGTVRLTVFHSGMEIVDRLAGASRIGLGLAAVGRPGYINLGRAADLPADRTVEALGARAHELLNQAYAAGVRYFDVARSYGRAEEFLAQWLQARPDVDDVVIGSKWGYTYTAEWRIDAEVHEVKDHGPDTFDRQLGETRALLGDRLSIYQIHSVTPDSPALHDAALHRRLADLAAQGTVIGLSTSGPRQAEAIRAALGVQVDGRPLFRSVQATWNLMEPSAGPALAEAHDAGCLVIIKEALANGRLATDGTSTDRASTDRASTDVASADVVALAAALQQPWASVVLSGAATGSQLTSNLRAERFTAAPSREESVAVPSDRYWQERSRLAWS
jgi:aryl-alcohol dehydrogenase-like predicted oxidoreductase